MRGMEAVFVERTVGMLMVQNIKIVAWMIRQLYQKPLEFMNKVEIRRVQQKVVEMN
jgi:hypothetical protein